MFDQLFTSSRGLAAHQNGPVAEERRRYLAHCASLQMTPGALRVIAVYTLIIARTLRLADRPSQLFTHPDIEAGASRYVKLADRRRHPKEPMKRKGGCLWYSFKTYATRWLKFMGRLHIPRENQRPYADQIARFGEYMHRERGLSPETIAYSTRTMQQFLKEVDDAGLRLKTLTVAQVNDLLAKKTQDHRYTRKTVRRWAGVLRPFFRFAEARGWCRGGLANGIATPRVYQHEDLPIGPSWDDVKSLLGAAEGDRPTDVRDRAILMLLAVYGLRGGEVRALRLEDLDWQQEVLIVRHDKQKKARTYPLCRSVGDAVLRYLREVRPGTDHREVFLTRVAPFRPLGRGGLKSIARNRLLALGLKLPHYGSHVLRHACATHLLAQGLSLKEIGDHLGHRSPQTTRIYAKVDLNALRTVGDFELEGLL
ncbi:MAG: integrase [Planctomycetes bacterium]|nr:integrase [Planctomycetota bacterium]